MSDQNNGRGVAVVVAGVAGSGKSTLGRAVATALRLPLIDLDSVTNPLLDSLPPELFGGHWLSSSHAGTIRAGRYAALRAVARDAVRTAGGAVLVAPFTAELQGGAAWDALVGALAPAAPQVVVLHGDRALFAARRAQRGEERDRHRAQDAADSPPPGVPALLVDARLAPAEQLEHVLAVLAGPTPAS